MLVAEWDRLLGTQTFTRDPWRTLQFVRGKTENTNQDDENNEASACVLVGTRWKKLRHLTVVSRPAEISQLGYG